jgi:hypothetical protein
MADNSSQSPSFFSGLMAGLNDIPSNPLFNMGMGLMQASAPFGNVGTSLMNANQATLANQAARQKYGMGQLQMRQAQAEFPLRMQWLQKAMGALQPPQGQADNSVPAQTGAPMPAPQISSAPGIDPQQSVNLGLAGGALGMPGAESFLKAPAALESVQKYLIQQRQQQAQPLLAKLDSVATSPQADTIINNDDGLKQLWAQTAPKLGFNSLTPANARVFARFAYNQTAGGASLPTKDMPEPLVDEPGPNGQLVQRHPISNKAEVAVAAQPLTSVVGAGGLPTLTPSGKAAGKQPFNEQIYGANSISDPAMERAYQQWKATGSVPAGQGRNVLAQAKQANYIAQRANEDNVPEQAAAAKQQQFKAQQAVVDDFTNPAGTAGKSLVSINTAVSHLGALMPLIDAMQSGNMTKINEARQYFQKQTGQPAPTNYQALANMASGEVSKAILAGGGGESERDEIASPFKAANGPEALKGAVQTVSTALAGKTEALRNAWNVGTNGTQGDFDKFLMTPTKKALGIPTEEAKASKHPANIQALLDKYK